MSDSAQVQSTYAMGEVHGFTRYVIYDNASGRIVKYGRARDVVEDGGASMAAQADAGQSALAVSAVPDPKVAYCPGGVPTPRPACPVTAAIVGRVITLSGIPVGSPYSVQGDASLNGIASDSTLIFTFGTGGMFKLTVDCFPAQVFTQGVTLA